MNRHKLRAAQGKQIANNKNKLFNKFKDNNLKKFIKTFFENYKTDLIEATKKAIEYDEKCNKEGIDREPLGEYCINVFNLLQETRILNSTIPPAPPTKKINKI